MTWTWGKLLLCVCMHFMNAQVGEGQRSASATSLIQTRPPQLLTLFLSAVDNMTDHHRSSPSPAPESLGSGTMEESDAEADAPGASDEEAPLYPLEGKYLNARDREDILALPEIRREELLAERAAEVTKKQQDLQLKRALAQSKAAANKHKRKATAADLDDDSRRTRPKADKAKSALDDYKRAREMKGTDRGRLDAGTGRRGERSPSGASDRDADGESEVEWAEPASDSRRDEPAAELKDFERCRIGRSNFAKICFYPSCLLYTSPSPRDGLLSRMPSSA